jgi:enoyl-CoA hydratase/carnithine racemase
MTYVKYETDDAIRLITLNRPERRNALGQAMLDGLAEAMHTFHDDESARVAILTGAGTAFCSGMDLKERAESKNGSLRLGRSGQDNLFFQAERDGAPPVRSVHFVKPVIAAVNGIASGAGLFLCLNADLIVVSSAAAFELSEVSRGIPAGWNTVAQLGLPRHVASELALGLRLSAARAYEIGIANRLVHPDQLLAEALAIASQLAALPPLAIQGNIEMMARMTREPQKDPWGRGLELRRQAEESDDLREATAAFAEKRRATFTGR